MKTKLHKHIADLQQYKYKPMFDQTPRLLVDLVDGDCQVCLAPHGDYINLDEAMDNLRDLTVTLGNIQSEMNKIRTKVEEGGND